MVFLFAKYYWKNYFLQLSLLRNQTKTLDLSNANGVNCKVTLLTSATYHFSVLNVLEIETQKSVLKTQLSQLNMTCDEDHLASYRGCLIYKQQAHFWCSKRSLFVENVKKWVRQIDEKFINNLTKTDVEKANVLENTLALHLLCILSFVTNSSPSHKLHQMSSLLLMWLPKTL